MAKFTDAVPEWRRVVEWYDGAPASVRELGHSWYERVHEALTAEMWIYVNKQPHPRKVNPNFVFDKLCGVLAALNTNASWRGACTRLRQLLAMTRAEMFSVASVCPWLRRTGVFDILCNDIAPMVALSGNKTRSFYTLLMRPSDLSGVVPVDRHCVALAISPEERADLAGSGRLRSWGRQWIKPNLYERMRSLYERAADELGQALPHVQATVWLWYREQELGRPAEPSDVWLKQEN